MPDGAIWEVDLVVDGSVAVRSHLRTQQQKGLRVDEPFYSDIHIANRPSNGFRATITARAKTRELAQQAAVFFFGHMLDALTLEIDVPMVVNLAQRDRERILRSRDDVRRVFSVLELDRPGGEQVLSIRTVPECGTRW